MTNKNNIKDQLLYLRGQLLRNMVEWTKPLYAFLFKQNKQAWTHNRKSLIELPEGSLGKTLGKFLFKQGFDLMPKFESHDVYHVLLDYDTTVVDEARMSFFLTGNGKNSLFILGSNLLAFLLIPEHFGTFIEDYKRGKAAAPISKWDFEYLLSEPINGLKGMIFRKLNETELPLFI